MSGTTEHLAENDLSHSMVHYLLTVHKLKERRGYARVTDIARDLGLTKGSVSIAINNLKKKGLAREEEDSKFLVLTDEGHREVHNILSSRTLLFYFLRDFVGVNEEAAQRDSCLMEHLLSSDTRTRLFNFMKELACASKNKDVTSFERFNTALNLSEFKDVEEFVLKQEGDSYLQEKLH